MSSSKKKRARETAQFEKNASPPARPATYCTRCGQGLPSAADIDTHNQLVHLAGGR